MTMRLPRWLTPRDRVIQAVRGAKQIASDSEIVVNGRHVYGDGSVSVSFEVTITFSAEDDRVRGYAFVNPARTVRASLEMLGRD